MRADGEAKLHLDELAVLETSQGARSVGIDADEKPGHFGRALIVRVWLALQILEDTSVTLDGIDRLETLRKPRLLTCSKQSRDLASAEQRVHGPTEFRPELDLSRNGSRCGLPRHARIEHEFIRKLDWLTHECHGSILLPHVQQLGAPGPDSPSGQEVHPLSPGPRTLADFHAARVKGPVHHGVWASRLEKAPDGEDILIRLAESPLLVTEHLIRLLNGVTDVRQAFVVSTPELEVLAAQGPDQTPHAQTTMLIRRCQEERGRVLVLDAAMEPSLRRTLVPFRSALCVLLPGGNRVLYLDAEKVGHFDVKAAEKIESYVQKSRRWAEKDAGQAPEPKPNLTLRLGVALLGGLAICLLLWALFGQPGP